MVAAERPVHVETTIGLRLLVSAYLGELHGLFLLLMWRGSWLRLRCSCLVGSIVSSGIRSIRDEIELLGIGARHAFVTHTVLLHVGRLSLLS